MDSPENSSPVTLRDIARVVGVSHVTVSLALQNHPRIPQERRTAIQVVAQSMGYRPNAIASALSRFKRSAPNPSIQSVLAWLNQWPQPRKLRSYIEFDRYWHGAQTAAAKFGYLLEEFVCDNSVSVSRLDKILTARGIRGILLPPHPQDSKWSELRWEKYAAIRFGRSIRMPRLHIVTSDQVANTMLAYTEIQRRGYKRICFVNGYASQRGGLYEAGYLMAHRRSNSVLEKPIFTINEDHPSASQQGLTDWLQTNKPDAILTDVGVTRQMLAKAGRRVPDDVGLVALSILDGNADAGIDQRPDEVGRVAVLFTLSLINDNATGIPPIFRQVLIEGSWVDGTTLPDRR